MTAAAIQPEPVPLIRDQAGRLMVEGTRVPLDVLVYAFKEGRSPEAIHQSFDTVALADVYSIFAYYLHHRAEVDGYLAQQEHEDEESSTSCACRTLACARPKTRRSWRGLLTLGESW